MNKYMRIHILNAIGYTKDFVSACKLAALKDDGEISKDEARILKKIEKASKRFEKELRKINGE